MLDTAKFSGRVAYSRATNEDNHFPNGDEEFNCYAKGVRKGDNSKGTVMHEVFVLFSDRGAVNHAVVVVRQ